VKLNTGLPNTILRDAVFGHARGNSRMPDAADTGPTVDVAPIWGEAADDGF
jgi:hypothetical protein